MLKISQSVIDEFGADLPERVAAYAAALEAHRFSMGTPRPVEHPLVEAITQAGGMDSIIILPVSPTSPGIPQITNFQARALLMQMPGSAEGRTLFQDVDDTLRQLGGISWQAWEYTTIFPRDSSLIATMAAQFNLTEAQLDQMFTAAAQISV